MGHLEKVNCWWLFSKSLDIYLQPSLCTKFAEFASFKTCLEIFSACFILFATQISQFFTSCLIVSFQQKLNNLYVIVYHWLFVTQMVNDSLDSNYNLDFAMQPLYQMNLTDCPTQKNYLAVKDNDSEASVDSSFECPDPTALEFQQLQRLGPHKIRQLHWRVEQRLWLKPQPFLRDLGCWWSHKRQARWIRFPACRYGSVDKRPGRWEIC